MAEPPEQAGSIARREDAGPPAPPRGLRALLAWLKLDGEPGKMAPALRVLLTFLKEVGAKQIEQVPGLVDRHAMVPQAGEPLRGRRKGT